MFEHQPEGPLSSTMVETSISVMEPLMRNGSGWLLGVLVWLDTLAGCGFPRPADVPGDGSTGATEYRLTIAKTGDSDGRVTAAVAGAPTGIDCGTDCTETFGAGTSVQLHAEPDAGASFIGWNGACSGVDCTITVLATTTITAEFRKNQCTPSTTVCSDNAMVACDALGHPTFTDCRGFGCWNSASRTPDLTGDRCADLDPSNGLAPYLDMAGAPSINLPDGITINTDTGVIVNNGQILTPPSFSVMQAGVAVEIRVFVTKDLVLRNTTVSGTRALAFVADGTVQILGQLTAAATYRTGAAGATNDPARCTAAPGFGGGDSTIRSAVGAGGGGHATSGGASGAIPSAGADPALGGAIVDTDLQPLVGGCGGAPSDGVSGSAPSGAGGGAVQIVSRTSITVAVVGTSVGKIHVGGGGGAAKAGIDTTQGGGGGGAGGGVLLEAPFVVVSGVGAIVAANGGGGGAGAPCAGNPAGFGENATASTNTAIGASGCNTSFTTGGNGAAGFTRATDAFDLVSSNLGATGGGGGGLGFLVVHNTGGQFSAQDGATVSAIIKQQPLRRRARP